MTDPVDPSELGTDAQKWAAVWCEVALDLVGQGRAIVDKGWMIGWFANAMANAERAQREKTGPLTEMEHLLVRGCATGWDRRLATHEVSTDVCSTCGLGVEYSDPACGYGPSTRGAGTHLLCYNLSAVTSHPPTEELGRIWDFLSPGERAILQEFHHHAHRMEQLMSDLTDQLDAALATLATDSAGYEEVIQANQATIAALQSALDAARAGQAADEAELQKALDTVTAVNSKLATLTGTQGSTQGAATGSAGDSGTPSPSDPGTPGQSGSPSDPVTVVEEPTPVGADGAPTPVETGAGDGAAPDGTPAL